MIIITQILRVIRVTIILVASFSSNQNHYNKMKTKAYNTVGTIQESFIITQILRVRVMMINATFNNISVISWQSALMVKKTGKPREYNRTTVSH
jgi:hypothetical protein